ncbi:hypothetical protein EMIT0P260_10008 [Pseudomonas sp. IT-P260]
MCQRFFHPSHSAKTVLLYWLFPTAFAYSLPQFEQKRTTKVRTGTVCSILTHTPPINS